jgi:hypothetical protein
MPLPLSIAWEQPGPDAPPRPRAWPPPDGPTLGQLTYTKELITVVLLLLALPWLVSKLLTDPGQVFSGLGRRAAGRVAS